MIYEPMKPKRFYIDATLLNFSQQHDFATESSDDILSSGETFEQINGTNNGGCWLRILICCIEL